jgi:alkenylglycerophosphocholine/alkenylglycerophosphoethanolamine hydrolase
VVDGRGPTGSQPTGTRSKQPVPRQLFMLLYTVAQRRSTGSSRPRSGRCRTGNVLRVTVVFICVGVAAVAALGDWYAVTVRNKALEYACKPAVLAALAAAAALIPAGSTDLSARRWWFVAALVLCLAGDVFLMLPGDLFIPGLASFLAGHVLFIVGLLQAAAPPTDPAFGWSATGLAITAVTVLVIEGYPGFRVARAVVRGDHPALIGPVAVYVAAIVTMVVLAWNVGVPLAAAGATSFLVSDTLLAIDRFDRPLTRGPLIVHMTYHVAQILLVLSLVSPAALHR